MGKNEDAVREYNRAYQLEKNNAGVLNNRGRAYFDLGKYNEAVKDFSEAITIDPKFAYAYCNRAAAYIKSEKFIEAKADATKAIELDASYGYAWLNRGIAREMLRDEPGACEDWKQARELGVKSAESYIAGGFCNN
jgi:tetratricopeptide (TPR) repeat protein